MQVENCASSVPGILSVDWCGQCTLASTWPRPSELQVSIYPSTAQTVQLKRCRTQANFASVGDTTELDKLCYPSNQTKPQLLRKGYSIVPGWQQCLPIGGGQNPCGCGVPQTKRSPIMCLLSGRKHKQSNDFPLPGGLADGVSSFSKTSDLEIIPCTKVFSNLYTQTIRRL